MATSSLALWQIHFWEDGVASPSGASVLQFSAGLQVLQFLEANS